MLGNTGIEVSRLCFGTLTLGPLQANLPLEEGAEIIAHAIRRGVTFFDTAQLYGTYDRLRRGMEFAGRDDIIISSKTYAYDEKSALEAVEEARRETNRDVIDVFLLHEQESDLTLRGHRDALDALYSCKAKGIIRAVGISTHHIAGVQAATRLGLDVVHPILNIDGLGIADGTRAEMELAVKRAREKGLGVFSMKALGGGNLLRKADQALEYALGQSCIDSIAVGIQSIEELDANIGFWGSGAFTDEEKRTLSKKTRKLHIENWCTGCGACVKRCGQNALSLGCASVVCEHDKCVLCGYCASVCEQWAIKVV